MNIFLGLHEELISKLQQVYPYNSSLLMLTKDPLAFTNDQILSQDMYELNLSFYQ